MTHCAGLGITPGSRQQRTRTSQDGTLTPGLSLSLLYRSSSSGVASPSSSVTVPPPRSMRPIRSTFPTSVTPRPMPTVSRSPSGSSCLVRPLPPKYPLLFRTTIQQKAAAATAAAAAWLDARCWIPQDARYRRWR